MTSKRPAASELNHDNWNKEEEPEYAGIFTKASDDILEKRVVKTARRRLLSKDGTPKSAFGAFKGFKTASTTQSSPFKFLANTNTNETTDFLKTNATTSKSTVSNGASKGNENGENAKEETAETLASQTKKNTTEQEGEKIFKKSSDYFAKLKGLNESVAQWIKTHVDANPFCILTPIFRDYERYLKDIESKHGSVTEKAVNPSEQAQSLHSSDSSKESTSTEKKLDTSPFGGTSTKTPSISTDWKPEKSIFGNIGTNPKSIFGKSEQLTDSSKSVFSNTDQTSDTHKSIFGNIEPKIGSKSVFGNINSDKNPFLNKSPSTDNKTEEESKSETKPTSSSFPSTNVTAATFSFGQSSTTSSASAGFSFGSAKPFTFGAQVAKPQDPDDKSENEGKDDDNDEPPKVEIKPISEEGAIFEQRCKVFVKKDGNFSDRGIGILFLKPTPNGKTQLIVRAETSLGNLLINTLLTENIPTKRMNKNTIMMVCLPKPDSSPPPVPVLLRVKTGEDADVLLETLNKYKK